jgi:hypothetical protein
MSGRPDVRPGRFDDAGDGGDRESDDRPERRPMDTSLRWWDLDVYTRAVLQPVIDAGAAGLGMIVRGWWSVSQALQVSPRTAQRMEAAGELVVAHERTPGGGHGRVWCTVAEIVNCARARAGLGPYVKPPEDDDEQPSAAVARGDAGAAGRQEGSGS